MAKAQSRTRTSAKGSLPGAAVTLRSPPTHAPSGLRSKQERFCLEYVLDHNGKQAAIRAGYSEGSAAEQAYENLRKPHIRARIGEIEQEVALKLGIRHEDLLARLWQQATGDVNDLVQARRVCCRYCYGVDHEYQWTTEREYREARDAFVFEIAGSDYEALIALSNAIEAGTSIAGLPTNIGGYGYDGTAQPNADCPECRGEGVLTIHVTDTRNSVSNPLYEGVKQTKGGIEVKIADRQKAIDQIARHLSFYKDTVELAVSEELLAAARAINAATPPIDADYMVENAPRLRFDE